MKTPRMNRVAANPSLASVVFVKEVIPKPTAHPNRWPRNAGLAFPNLVPKPPRRPPPRRPPLRRPPPLPPPPRRPPHPPRLGPKWRNS